MSLTYSPMTSHERSIVWKIENLIVTGILEGWKRWKAACTYKAYSQYRSVFHIRFSVWSCGGKGGCCFAGDGRTGLLCDFTLIEKPMKHRQRESCVGNEGGQGAVGGVALET